MSRVQSYACAACEQIFGSKWALDDHAKNCPVRRNAELARIQEALEWKQSRIESSVGICYRYAARGFLAYHTGRPEEARRFRDWFVDEYQQSLDNLKQLSSGLREASRLLFPRLERMSREVESLLEQAKDLAAIRAVLIELVDGSR
jgi:hypothetical protein